MAENVRGLLTHDDGRTLNSIKEVISELGYELVEPKVLKAMFYKVPQKRERLILVGIRKDLAGKAIFKWPSGYSKVLTLRDAFLLVIFTLQMYLSLPGNYIRNGRKK